MYLPLDDKKYQDYLAHRKEGKESETLLEHLELTKNYLERIIQEKNLNTLIDNLIAKIDDKYQNFIKKLFVNAIYLHDLGKTNPAFQDIKMKNPLFSATDNNSNHSMLGAIEYIEYFKDEIEAIDESEDEAYYRLIFIMYSFSYHISKHHGSLTSIENYLDSKIDRDKHASFYSVKQKVENYLNSSFEFYILNKLLFSLLVSSDYYATTEYMANLTTNDFGLISNAQKQNIIEAFENNKIIQAIRANEVEGINVLRSQMFLEAEQNLLKNLDKHIFYLEAPTGSGKTLTSINLALKLLQSDNNINKLFYIFPFNTLVEQTRKVLKDIFGDTLDIEVINSITPINHKDDTTQEEKESNYQKSYMSRLFFHSELIISTHIAFFNILFGTSKEDNFPLWQLANSVIILDEIQSYDNNLWSYMTKFFALYAKALNIKIIIMSATLPKLDLLIKSDEPLFVDLISNRSKYFEDDYFKKRVDIDYGLLGNKEITFDDLKEKLFEESQSYNKILFEFIKKQSAREFYNLIKEDKAFEGFEIYELSGDDNKAFRQKVINRTKEEIKIIVIATQVIEAGVDIDMDLGFKDISTLDSEEQFMGRINRSCAKLHLNPKVYFFDMDDERGIYKGDNRVEFNLKQKEYQDVLKSKNFKPFYDEVLNKLKRKDDTINSGLLGNLEAFEQEVKKLNYRAVQDKMQLIKSQNFTLYFPFALEIAEYDFEEFKDIDEKFMSDGKLDGQKVWEEFKLLDTIEGFAQRAYEKSTINALMQFFTFSIYRFDVQEQPPYYSGDCNKGYYLVRDLEFITDDGKFDREAYNEKANSTFL